MNRLRALRLILGSMVIASLLIACDSSAEIAAPTAAPTAVPEPPTAAPIPTVIPGPADSSEVPRTTPEELKEHLDSGEEILIVDTRGQVAYDYRHVPGAVMAPENYDDVPHDQEIVLYCA